MQYDTYKPLKYLCQKKKTTILVLIFSNMVRNIYRKYETMSRITYNKRIHKACLPCSRKRLLMKLKGLTMNVQQGQEHRNNNLNLHRMLTQQLS